MTDVFRFTLQQASRAADILKKETLRLEKNVRISTGIALTKTARIAVQELGEATEKYFDRPTRWTKRGFFFLPATKANNNTVTVGIKDERALPGLAQQKGGNPAVFYLQPNVEGGQRNAKGIEKKLRATGVLGPNEYTVPGSGVRLNRYGNIPRATLSRMIAEIGQARGFGNTLGQATTRRGGRRFFYDPNLRPRAIWQRYGRGGRRARPFLLFVKRPPQYRKRFPFNDIVERTFDRHLDNEFEKAFNIGRARR